MQRIVIVDGPDMTGKTEITSRLARKLGISRFKASSEHQTFLHETDKFVNQLTYADPRVADFIMQTKQSVVFDRAYPSEWVYSRVLGRKTNEKALEHVDAMYATMGTLIVICHRSSYRGIVDDLDEKIDETLLQALDAQYVNFLKWTKCKHMMLNVDDEDLDREIKDITFVMSI